MLERAEELLRIRHGEGRRAVLLFTQLLACSGLFIVGRTVRDTLFLSYFPVAWLPWMFVGYGVASAILVALYTRFADSLPRQTVLVATAALGGLSYLAVWIASKLGQTWAYPVFYIWAEVLANLFLLQFWTFAADFHDARTAKRLNGFIGAARPLGLIVFPLSVSALVDSLGTEQLLFGLAILAGVVAGCVLGLGGELRLKAETKAPSRDGKGHPHPLRDGYVRTLSLLILLMFVSLTIGDYQFKAIARASYDKEELARFFSLFYGLVGGLAVAFQILVTPRLLARIGVGGALTVMPAVFGAASGLLFFLPNLAVVSAVKFADNGFQFTLHDTTVQSLYAPFPSAARARLRAFLDGAIKPLSYGAGGLLTAALIPLVAHLSPTPVGQAGWLSAFTLVLSLAWLALVPGVRRSHAEALERTISGPLAAQIFDQPFVIGPVERGALLRALDSANPVLCLSAIGQLATEAIPPPEVRAALARMLRRSEPEIRQQALEHLGRLGAAEAAEGIREASADADPAVRGTAVAALANLEGEDHPDRLRSFLDDADMRVRIEAAVGLLRFGGVEGAAWAGGRVLGLANSPNPVERREACRMLARLGPAAFRPLRALIGDAALEVRVEALRAAAAAPDRRLVDPLIEVLRIANLQRRAITALVNIGPEAVPAVARVLHDPSTLRPLRVAIPRILGRIPCRASLEALRQAANDPDSHVRLRVYSAFAKVREQLRNPGEPLAEIAPRIEFEMREACAFALGWERARARFATPVLNDAMALWLNRAERRVVRLLQWRYDRRQLNRVLAALRDPARRSDALETLDALLDTRLRRTVVRFLDDETPMAAKAEALPGMPPVAGEVDFMRSLTRHANPFVAGLGLHAMGAAGEPAGRETAIEALGHPGPFVRECAMRCLATLLNAEAVPLIRPLAADPDPILAAQAERVLDWLAIGRIGAELWEQSMYGTIEKILFLRGTPLFADLPAEDIAHLARAAEVIAYEAGDVVFREGDGASELFVVATGRVAVEFDGLKVSECGPSEPLGEIALLDHSPRGATARVLEPTELLRIGADEFFEILHDQPQIAHGLLVVMARRLRAATWRQVADRKKGDATSKDGQEPPLPPT